MSSPAEPMWPAEPLLIGQDSASAFCENPLPAAVRSH